MENGLLGVNNCRRDYGLIVDILSISMIYVMFYKLYCKSTYNYLIYVQHALKTELKIKYRKSFFIDGMLCQAQSWHFKANKKVGTLSS